MSPLYSSVLSPLAVVTSLNYLSPLHSCIITPLHSFLLNLTREQKESETKIHPYCLLYVYPVFTCMAPAHPPPPHRALHVPLGFKSPLVPFHFTLEHFLSGRFMSDRLSQFYLSLKSSLTFEEKVGRWTNLGWQFLFEPSESVFLLLPGFHGFCWEISRQSHWGWLVCG